MVYPNNKQIQKKKEDLTRCLRNFHMGFATAQMVKNEFKCLFTDVGLDMSNKHDKFCENGNFEAMLKDWEESE
jgi:hypothetical protein